MHIDNESRVGKETETDCHRSQGTSSTNSCWDWQKILEGMFESELESMFQTQLKQVRADHVALSGRTDVQVLHWLPELLQISSSCTVRHDFFSREKKNCLI